MAQDHSREIPFTFNAPTTVHRFILSYSHIQIDGDIPLFAHVNSDSSSESDGITERCWVLSLCLLEEKENRCVYGFRGGGSFSLTEFSQDSQITSVSTLWRNNQLHKLSPAHVYGSLLSRVCASGQHFRQYWNVQTGLNIFENFTDLYQSGGFDIDFKKMHDTYITRREQGTIGLRHVHVVVVILELQKGEKKHNEPMSVANIRCY